MLREPNVHELQCIMADAVYEEYQKQMYGLDACHSDYNESDMEEHKLLLDLKRSGATCLKKTTKIEAAGHNPLPHYPSPIPPPTSSIFVMTFVQSNPAGTWLIQHNLGYNPIVEAYNNEGTPVPSSIKYLDRNSLQLTFNTIIGGKAYLYQSY